MEEIWVGTTRICFEDPEFMVIRIHGTLEPGEMKKILEVHDARLLERERLFVLCDVKGAAKPSYSSRQELKDRRKKLPRHWAAFIGVPKEFGIFLDLMMRAVSVLSSSKVVHRCFPDEPLARAWLTEMKEKANLSA